MWSCCRRSWKLFAAVLHDAFYVLQHQQCLWLLKQKWLQLLAEYWIPYACNDDTNWGKWPEAIHIKVKYIMPKSIVEVIVSYVVTGFKDRAECKQNPILTDNQNRTFLALKTFITANAKTSSPTTYGLKCRDSEWNWPMSQFWHKDVACSVIYR